MGVCRTPCLYDVIVWAVGIKSVGTLSYTHTQDTEPMSPESHAGPRSGSSRTLPHMPGCGRPKNDPIKANNSARLEQSKSKGAGQLQVAPSASRALHKMNSIYKAMQSRGQVRWASRSLGPTHKPRTLREMFHAGCSDRSRKIGHMGAWVGYKGIRVSGFGAGQGIRVFRAGF